MAASQYWFRTHPLSALSLIGATGLMIVIVILEFGARIVFSEWGPTLGGERVTFCEYDDLLGWAHRPNMSAGFSRQEFSVDVTINSNRLRDHEYPVGRNEKNRMLVLGDSFGWGYGVDLTDRFDEVLERRHSDWEIINASVSGYGTDQQFLYLRDRGIVFKPDVVLLLLYSNDFVNNNAAAQYFLNKPYFTLQGTDLELHNTPVPALSIPQRLAHSLGRTYVLGRAYVGAKQFLADMTRRRNVAEQESGSSGDYQLTLQLISNIQRISRENGADFILVSVPMGDDSKAVLRKLSDRAGFPYLPLDNFFENSGDESTFFPNDGHWNAYGHRITADAVDAYLTEINVFQVPAATAQ
jgi:lysophospholipase L1-like esterase